MRRLPLFTGSGVGRALACTASTVLPQSEDTGDTTARDAGTTVHRFVERAAAIGRDAALAEIPTDAPGYAACVDLDLDALPFDALRCEMELALAYDAATGGSRRLVDGDGQPIRNRQYDKAVPPLKESETPMTLDAVEIVEGYEHPDGDPENHYPGEGDTVVRVWDLKTGQPHHGYHEQVRLGALAVATLPERGTARVRCEGGLIYTRGGVRIEDVDCSDDALSKLSRDIDDTHFKADRLPRVLTRDDVSPGDHCRFCKSRMYCPETSEAAWTLAGVDPEPENALTRFEAEIETDERAADWWLRLGAMEALLPKVREALEKRAQRSPFSLPDGSVVAPVTERGDRYVADIDAVAARLGDKADEVMPVVTKRKAPIGAIEKVLGKAAMKELEASGAVRRGNETTTVKATKANRKQVA